MAHRLAVGVDPAGHRDWFLTPLGRRVWSHELQALRHLLGQPAGRHVLDAGAGDARLAADLAEQGARVVTVDSDHAMVRAARDRLRRAPTRVSLVRADAAALPFRPGSFDAAAAVTVLCVADRPAAIVRELGRVVRGGGQVVLGELGRWSLWAAGRRLGGRSGVRFWTARRLGALLGDAGLVAGSPRGAVFYPRSARVARAMGGLDQWLGRVTTLGAAFIAVAGRKPERPPGR
ncbi:MAG: methyltransferase domain-containing protein [Gemmatimonadetes bacterium]|nr:methyltransferase domain-containing protein [Gemmatimonadota bacterium]